MDKITVAHVAGGLTTGGVENVVYNYVSHMKSEAYNWIYVSYDTPDPQVKAQFEKIGFQVYTVTKKKKNFIKSCWEVYGIFKENHVAIVHSHMTIMCFVTNTIGWLSGARERISHSHLEMFPKGGKKVFYGICKWLTNVTSTSRFACSKEAAIYLYGKKPVEKGQVIIMSNALEWKTFQFDQAVRDHMRNIHGLEGSMVMGHVGRFTEQKNHEFLLEIFAEYHRRQPRSKLVLVGTGPLMGSIADLAKKQNLSDSILFAGSTHRVGDWYMAMDLFVFPSRYEGLGIAAVEAQLTGLPVFMSTAVPKEAVVADRVWRGSICDPAKRWAAQMPLSACDDRAGDLADIVEAKHLDINVEAKRLDAFYRNGQWGSIK